MPDKTNDATAKEKWTILMVDDNPWSLNGEQTVLTGAGHDVHIVAGLEEAVEFLKDHFASVNANPIGVTIDVYIPGTIPRILQKDSYTTGVESVNKGQVLGNYIDEIYAEKIPYFYYSTVPGFYNGPEDDVMDRARVKLMDVPQSFIEKFSGEYGK